jgi:hypothetical protein
MSIPVIAALTGLRLRTITQAVAFGRTAAQYATLRRAHPMVSARWIKRYIDDQPPLTLEQFVCEATTGHRWSHTGTAFGGEDETFRGEGRVYCLHCGADGDA